jgi:phage baseplate assembly protein V
MHRARVSLSISGMNQLADILRRLDNLIRSGTIAAVQMNPPRVRVQSGNITTAWLPWISLRAGEDREWDPPTVDEQAVVFSPSGQLTQGVVLVGLFSDLIPANGDREGLHRRTYRDGAVIEYDSIAKHLRATLPGTAEVTAAGDISLTSGGKIQITAAGDVVITGANVRIN